MPTLSMNDLKVGQGSWQLADSDTLLYISAMTNTNTTTKNITKTKDQDCDQDLHHHHHHYHDQHPGKQL